MCVMKVMHSQVSEEKGVPGVSDLCAHVSKRHSVFAHASDDRFQITKDAMDNATSNLQCSQNMIRYHPLGP